MINKKKFSFILFILFILFLTASFFYLKNARYQNKWPFGTKLGYAIPASLKRVVYNLMTDDVKYIESHHYKIKKTFHQIPNHKFLNYGGAIEQLDDENILLISSHGYINIFNLKNKRFTINENNLENYESVRDTIIDYDKKELRVLATYKLDEKCGTIKFIKYNYQFSNNNFKLSNEELIWQSEKNCKYQTKLSGARIVEINGEYLLSTGIFQAPKRSGIIDENWSQRLDSSFGKVIKIDKNNNASIFALGFRNPQGLFFAKNKNLIFGTDHGPRGGDEVNIIYKEQNYGWPCMSYGKLYSKKINEEKDLYPNIKTLKDKNCSNQISYKAPLYAFAKSQGISQGLYYQAEHFKVFKENIIVTTLKGKSIYRFLLDSNSERIITMEKIKIGLRIRDIMATTDGKILLTTDKGFLIIVEKSV